MKERARAIIRAPVVMKRAVGRQPRHQVCGAFVRRLSIDLLVTGAIQLRRRHQCAVIVQDVFRMVVQQLAIVRFQKSERVFCGLQILRARKVAVLRHGAGQRQRGNRHACPGAIAGLIRMRT